MKVLEFKFKLHDLAKQASIKPFEIKKTLKRLAKEKLLISWFIVDNEVFLTVDKSVEINLFLQEIYEADLVKSRKNTND